MKSNGSASAITLLAVFALSRGSAYGFTRIALDLLSPGNVLFLRLGFGSLALLIWAGLSLRSLCWVASDWRGVLFYASFGNVLPIGLITIGQETVPSGVAAVMMALTPLCSALLAHFWLPGERLRLQTILGLALGFAGVLAIVAARDGLQTGAGRLPGLAALAAAALCFAINIVFARRWRPESQVGTAALSLVGATVCAVPFIQPPGLATSSSMAIGASVALGVISTALALLVMLELSKRAGAAFISTVNYLIPIVGLTIGALFLHEPLFWSDVLAFGLVISGTRLVQPAGIAELPVPRGCAGQTAR